MAKRQRVLLYRLGSMGDMLVAVPAFRLVQRAFPEAERRLLTNLPVSSKAAAAETLLQGTGFVEGYFRYPVGTRNLRELLSLWWTLWRWRPDVLVYLAAARGTASAARDAKFFRWCGVKRMVGVPLTKAMQQNFAGDTQRDLWTAELEPEAARLARNISELGDAGLADSRNWDLALSATEHVTAGRAIGAEALGKEMFAISVGTKLQANHWSRENWGALLQQLAVAYPGRALLLTGAREESEESEAAAEAWRASGGGPVVNLCGKLQPRESAAALARARLFLGHDSGPMHLAASTGTPCVAVFSARNLPRQWFPLGKQHRVLYHRVECAGCGLETCIEQRKKCLLSITVHEVMSAVAEVMQAPRVAPSAEVSSVAGNESAELPAVR